MSEKLLSGKADGLTLTFKENGDWLCFGYHAKSAEREIGKLSVTDIISEFELTSKELKRITGNTTDTLRLSYYQGSKDTVTALHNRGIKVLLTSSINKQSYYLDSTGMDILRLHDTYSDDGLVFVHTDICLDDINQLELLSKIFFTSMNNEQGKIISIFTHEWQLNPMMYDRLGLVCQFLYNHDYNFVINLGSYI